MATPSGFAQPPDLPIVNTQVQGLLDYLIGIDASNSNKTSIFEIAALLSSLTLENVATSANTTLPVSNSLVYTLSPSAAGTLTIANPDESRQYLLLNTGSDAVTISAGGNSYGPISSTGTTSAWLIFNADTSTWHEIGTGGGSAPSATNSERINLTGNTLQLTSANADVIEFTATANSVIHLEQGRSGQRLWSDSTFEIEVRQSQAEGGGLLTRLGGGFPNFVLVDYVVDRYLLNY